MLLTLNPFYIIDPNNFVNGKKKRKVERRGR